MNFPQRMTMQQPEPLFHREEPAANLFIRLITAQAIGAATRTPPQMVASIRWPSDRAVMEMLTRAASAPAMTSVTGWAAELTHRVVADGLKALGPVSAGAQIFKHSLVLTFSGAELISAPGIVGAAGNAGFVAEGAPIPVRQLATNPALVNPHKMAAIAVLTREMIESSNAEALIRDALMLSIGAALDTVLFDANPEDTIRPPGLRNGIAALTASAATDGFEAVFEDISALIDAIAPVGGPGPYVIIASPGRSAGLRQRFTNFEVDPMVVAAASTAVGNNVLVIAPGALVAALSPAPEVETATTATLVMDTAPGAAGTMGAEKSMFQTDSMALKIRWPISWVLRDPRGAAWLTPNWK